MDAKQTVKPLPTTGDAAKWDALRKAAEAACSAMEKPCDYKWPHNELLALPPYYVCRVYAAKANPAAILELLSELDSLKGMR